MIKIKSIDNKCFEIEKEKIIRIDYFKNYCDDYVNHNDIIIIILF